MMAEAMRIPKQLNPTKVRCPAADPNAAVALRAAATHAACIGACVRIFRGMGLRTVVAGK